MKHLPVTAQRIENDLLVGGCSVTSLAEQFGTPLFVLDEADLRLRARAYVDGLVSRRLQSTVFFASKSLPIVEVIRVLHSEGLGVDVSTEGELRFALAADVPGDMLLLHGNAKSTYELQLALDNGVATIVCDNLDDANRLEQLATRDVQVLIRIVPEIPPATVAGMATAHRGQKFGIEPEQLDEIIDFISKSQYLKLIGFHAHVGSQITSLAPFAASIGRLAALGHRTVIDIGGGLGVPHHVDDEVPSIDEYLDRVCDELAQHVSDDTAVFVEPGRSLVALAGLTVYRVQTIKHGTTHTFVAVDGGTSDHIGALVEEINHDAFTLKSAGERVDCKLVGKHCDSGDVICQVATLTDPQLGDLVVLPTTGAYRHAMASNYNLVPRPPVVMCRDGQARIVVKGETIEDLLSREVSVS